MTLDFAGKKAIVTGGVSGIGAAAVEALRAAGAGVHIIDRHGEPPVDVSDRAALEAAFDRAGVPDVVIINAGIGYPADLTETTEEHWERTIAINLTGAFRTLQIAAARMKPRRRGAIVLTASTNSYDGEPCQWVRPADAPVRPGEVCGEIHEFCVGHLRRGNPDDPERLLRFGCQPADRARR